MEETTRRGFMGGMAAVGACAAIGAVDAESKQGGGLARPGGANISRHIHFRIASTSMCAASSRLRRGQACASREEATSGCCSRDATRL